MDRDSDKDGGPWPSLSDEYVMVVKATGTCMII